MTACSTSSIPGRSEASGKRTRRVRRAATVAEDDPTDEFGTAILPISAVVSATDRVCLAVLVAGMD